MNIDAEKVDDKDKELSEDVLAFKKKMLEILDRQEDEMIKLQLKQLNEVRWAYSFVDQKEDKE